MAVMANRFADYRPTADDARRATARLPDPQAHERSFVGALAHVPGSGTSPDADDGLVVTVPFDRQMVDLGGGRRALRWVCDLLPGEHFGAKGT